MKIAVAYENGQVFQHFGHTERFKVYDIKDDKTAVAAMVSTDGSGHGALADLLKNLHVDALICGGIGDGAKKAMAEANIKLYGGVSGSADAAIENFIAGKLKFDPEVTCNHHGEHHHDDTCGGHGGHDHTCHH